MVTDAGCVCGWPLVLRAPCVIHVYLGTAIGLVVVPEQRKACQKRPNMFNTHTAVVGMVMEPKAAWIRERWMIAA